MNNKHKAVIGVLLLIIVFLGLTLWYMATHKAPAHTPLLPTQTTQGSAPTVSGSQTLNESSTYYEITATYPSATRLGQTATTAADAAAVAEMKAFEEKEIAKFKDNGNFANLSATDIQTMGLDQRKYTLSIAYKAYQGANTVSYVYSLEQDTGGAHPIGYYRTFTYDAKTGTELDISDIFTAKANYLSALSNAARADLPKIIASQQGSAADVSYLTRGTTPDADNFQSWYIDGNSLVLVFPPYQVGPYSLGTVLDPIAFSRLTAILNPAYK